MSAIGQAVTWLNDPLNWTNPDGILVRLGEHLRLSGGALLLAVAVGWPLGIWLGHRGSRAGVVVLLSNVTQALPVIALLTVLPLTFLSFGPGSVIVALAGFAVPPGTASCRRGRSASVMPSAWATFSASSFTSRSRIASTLAG